MFDDSRQKQRPYSPKEMDAWRAIRKIQVTAHCYLCGQPIPLYWEEGNCVLEGRFMSDGGTYSEVFEQFVPDMHKIRCTVCT